MNFISSNALEQDSPAEGELAALLSISRRMNGFLYRCKNDPSYTIRAWRGVLTYLLRRPEFLYE